MTLDDSFDGTSDRPVARFTTTLAHSVRWLLPIAIAVRVLTYFAYESDFSQFVDLVLTTR